MNIPESVINSQSPIVASMFRQWEAFMESKVKFWDIPGDLDIHTQGHCERVLMHALRISSARGDSAMQMEALAHAAVFHDTRRKDNYLDTGHGARAAEYYARYCKDHKDEISYHPETYAAMWYHDRDDTLGDAFIKEHAGKDADSWLEVYHVFKDADALDRLRLGEWCLDPKYLRTEESHGMVAFAQQLVNDTIPAQELRHTYSLTDPFRPTASAE